jgi:hypothetical protein
MSAELLPGRLLTASNCIASFVPDAWTFQWTRVAQEERLQTADTLGIRPEELPALVKHVTEAENADSFGWPNVVKSEKALGELAHILPRSPEWVVLGLGLHRDNCASFLRENAPTRGGGAAGVHEMVTQSLALPLGGTFIGFEPLAFEPGLPPHSWLCNRLETECFRSLGIRPLANGQLGTEEDAVRATAHIAHLAEDGRAEPAQWLAWMMLDYTGARGPA